MATPIKLEAVPDTPPELAPAVAKKVNEGFATSQANTKTKLLNLMGKPATDAKLLKESATKEAAADLKSFKEKVLDKPAEMTEAIRADVHDKILAVLGGVIKVGTPEQQFSVDKLDEYKEKFKKEAAEKTEHNDAHDNHDGHGPEVQPQITDADSSVYSTRQVAKGALIGTGILAGATAAGAVGSGISAANTGGTFLGGVGNFFKATPSFVAQPFKALGLPSLWNSAVVKPATWLATKLGITTGSTATNAALAGLPSWMGTAAGGTLLGTGVYLGSKVVNGVGGWLGKKIDKDYKPWQIPILGKIPIIGGILNSLLVAPQLAKTGVWKGGSWIKKLLSGDKQIMERVKTGGRFGLGAWGGAAILAGLTGGSALLWGLLGGMATKNGLKGKSFTDFVPRPFGGGGGGGHAHAAPEGAAPKGH